MVLIIWELIVAYIILFYLIIKNFIMIIDQKHLLITTDKRAYIVANVGNNG